MIRRTRIGLLAVVATVAAALVFAAPGSSDMGPVELTTALSLNGETSLSYGDSLTLGGRLTYEAIFGGEILGFGGASVAIGDCDSDVLVNTATTDSDGNYSYGPFSPGADSYAFESYFAAWTDPDNLNYSYTSATSDCLYVTVEQATAQLSVTNTLPTTLRFGDSFTIAYKVESADGVAGNIAEGAVSIDSAVDPSYDEVGCDSQPLSAAQTASGFTTTGTLTCTPAAAGSYHYYVYWNGDDNYTDAKTSPEYTLTVTKKYAGTPGQRSCVGDTIAALVKEHGSLKAAANALGFASQNALRKDVQAYCNS